MKNYLLKLIALLIILDLSLFASMDFYVTKTCGINTLTKKEIKYIYLRKYKNIKQVRIIPLISKSENLNNKFIEDVLKKNKYNYEAYWSRMIFTGRASPPRVHKKMDINDKKCYITFSSKDILLEKNFEERWIKIELPSSSK